MNHDKAHCTGEIGSYTCSIRDTCLRYHLHLDAEKQNLHRVSYLNHVADLGYGKIFTFNIRNGCCEYIESTADIILTTPN